MGSKLTNCKICNAQIATSAKTCPNCGAKIKNPIYKRVWFWVIVVLIVIGIGANLGNDKNNSVNTSAKEEEKVITKIGQSVTTKDFIVTLEAVNKLLGDKYNSPADGKEFVELILVIENISDEEYSISSLAMFKAYEDNYAINESISAGIASDTSSINGTLAPKRKLRGKLAYELSKSRKELEIDIDLTLLSFTTDDDNKIKIQIQNQ